jgi:hypothetical protein
MKTLITVATFTLPSDLAIVKGRLESEGIECFVSDEMTVQVYNFVSNAVGGIKLKVRAEDVDRAREILQEAGHLRPTDMVPSEPTGKWYKLTQKIPFLNRMPLAFQPYVLAGIIISSAIIALAVVSMPSDYDHLLDANWCVEYIEHEGKKYKTDTTNYPFLFYGHCREELHLLAHGSVVLPGFETDAVSAKWTFHGDSIRFYQTDNFGQIYEGMFHIDISGYDLTLTSANTVIYAYDSW